MSLWGTDTLEMSNECTLRLPRSGAEGRLKYWTSTLGRNKSSKGQN